MKWYFLILVVVLQGCSVNSFLYSPNDKIGSLKSDFSHQARDTALLSESGNYIHLQHHHTTHPLGLVIHFHGNRGNLTQTVEKVIWMVEQGYDVLLVDYSGYGRSTGEATRDNLALDAKSVLQQVSVMNYDHKVIVATSMGGAVALDGLVLSGLSHYFDLLIIDSSFDSYQKLAFDVVSEIPILGWFKHRIPKFVNEEGSPAINIATIENLQVIVAHCEADSLIPIARGQALYRASRPGSEFWLFKGCNHARTFTNQFPKHQHRLLNYIKQQRLVALRAKENKLYAFN